ncbi:hypothetical protein MRB53_030156 [Persea americana]|uniref:Uncharacterized protein n=1 Tax=Persea americana TaxID=3435 RepID=A0ACC2KKH8_PERAE|nr:hypothetical protein MRB53_030156 [Persea americana]
MRQRSYRFKSMGVQGIFSEDSWRNPIAIMIPRRKVSDEIKLKLGLSLGGRFGTDPKDKWLLRLSLIIGLKMMPRDVDLAPPVAALPLIRTCSLPTRWRRTGGRGRSYNRCGGWRRRERDRRSRGATEEEIREAEGRQRLR